MNLKEMSIEELEDLKSEAESIASDALDEYEDQMMRVDRIQLALDERKSLERQEWLRLYLY